RPRSQSTNRMIAIVHSMVASTLRPERVTQLGPGSFERGLDRNPIALARALQELEPVKRLVVLRLGSLEKLLAPGATRRDGLVRARRQRGKLRLDLCELRLHLRFVGIPG